MKRLLLTVLFGAFTLLASAAPRPNVILIFSDDQGYNDVSCFGGEIPTPNIDSIARNGAKFTDFYVASPVCTPSRFSLLTGRYPNRSQDQLLGPLMFVEGPDLQRGIHKGETTLAEMLKGKGYRTALAGKWHLGHGEKHYLPTNHGFDTFLGHTGGCIDYFTMKYGNRPSWYRDTTFKEESGYATDIITEEAIRFINAGDQEPFFLYLAYNAPHFAKSWDDGNNQFLHLLQAKPEDIAAFSHIQDWDRRVYAAMVKAMDDGIGRILGNLKERGIAENTLVIFICDNGADPKYGGSNLPLRGAKHTLWEGGIRVPAVMQWPGRIQPGVVIDQPASALDIVPTVTKFAKVDTSGLTLDGIDLAPALFRGRSTPRYLYFNRGFDMALRFGRWKYIRDRASEPALFDLRRDPTEQNDLAAKRPEKLAELMAAHDAISAQLPSPEAQPFQENLKKLK